MKERRNKSPLTETIALRRKAEAHLQVKSVKESFCHDEEGTRRLVHELEVHQIELEMQNAELRQARYDLETALEKYTDLYEFAPVGYANLDHTGVIIALNLAGASLIGGVRSSLIGCCLWQFVAVADRLNFNDFLGKVLSCRIKESCEVALLNGENRPVMVQIEAMATASGQEFRLAMIDITERRRAGDALALKQRELEELNRSLDERIGQDVEELRRKDQILILQDRRVALGEMIGNIAHQWRQPLNLLGLYVQELPLDFDNAESGKEFLSDYAVKSMQLIKHMSKTIEDFSDFYRLDKEKVSFNVNEVIEMALSLVGESFNNQRINFEFCQKNELLINGYPNEYAQVLVNIFMNARDALVGRTDDDARITIRSFAAGGKTVVTITDNAGGISDEIIDRIFDPYFTTKEPDKGTGIGLFMSKAIIETNMGGTLTVHNAANGAEFRIVL